MLKRFLYRLLALEEMHAEIAACSKALEALRGTALPEAAAGEHSMPADILSEWMHGEGGER